MFKGIRNAQCGWVEAIEEDNDYDNDNDYYGNNDDLNYNYNDENKNKNKNKSPIATSSTSKTSTTSIKNNKGNSGTKKITLFLVIYSPLRGIVEIYHMRHSRRVGNFTVGQGWNLL